MPCRYYTRENTAGKVQEKWIRRVLAKLTFPREKLTQSISHSLHSSQPFAAIVLQLNES